MVAFNFQIYFVPRIVAGTKRHTVRRGRRCAPGQPMQLYTGLRTKKCTLIDERTCEVVDYIHIAPDGLTLGDSSKHPRDIDEFAILGGFKDFAAMQQWFARLHSATLGHFTGHVHRWAERS